MIDYIKKITLKVN